MVWNYFNPAKCFEVELLKELRVTKLTQVLGFLRLSEINVSAIKETGFIWQDLSATLDTDYISDYLVILIKCKNTIDALWS